MATVARRARARSAPPVPERIASVRRAAPPVDISTLVFVAACVVFASVYVWMLYRSHTFVHTVDYDQGLWDQYTWGAANGYFHNTVRGLPFLGHHVSLGLFLFAPFYWFGAGARFLDFVQVMSIVAAAVGLFRLGRFYKLGPVGSLIGPLLLLLNFSVSGALVAHFHPETVAVGPLVWTWYFARQGRRRATAAFVVLTLIWKEDVALTVFGLGLAHAALTPSVPIAARRRVGAAMCGFALAWFLISTLVIVPAFSPGDGAFYGERFSLGQTAPEAIHNSVVHPSRVVEQLDRSNAVGYTHKMTAAYGFLPLVAPASLLISLPLGYVLNDLGFGGGMGGL